jgi:uncharacterized cupin superfamily protein
MHPFFPFPFPPPRLVNKSEAMVVYLEVGDRTLGDRVTYPDDDIIAESTANGWMFTRKDGSLYESLYES